MLLLPVLPPYFCIVELMLLLLLLLQLLPLLSPEGVVVLQLTVVVVCVEGATVGGMLSSSEGS